MKWTSTARQGYANLWTKAEISPEREAQAKAIAQKLIRNRARYEEIETATGVPWWWIACIHERESSCDFTTYLGNGEPLHRVTRLVPRGRGPFPDWESGAIDALKYQGFDKVKDWSLPAALYRAEEYNGWGYVSKGVNSPYVWAWTSNYARGKYVQDGAFSPSTVDPQPGVAAMLKMLITLIPNLIPKLVPEVSSARKRYTVPSAGVTISTAQNLATHLIAAVGAILATSGASSASSLYDFLTNSTFLGGTLISLVAAGISQLNVIGANENTLKMFDKVVVALTPEHQTLLQRAAAGEKD